jgi:hypothetical protein
MIKTQTQLAAKAETQRQLQIMGFAVHVDGPDLEARKNEHRLRIKIRGLQERNAIFLKKRDLIFVDTVVVYIISSKECWVFTKTEAQQLLEDYEKDMLARKGRPPADEGFNVSQLPEPTGWLRFNLLVQT